MVVVSSTAQLAGSIDFDDLTWERRAYVPWRAYGQARCTCHTSPLPMAAALADLLSLRERSAGSEGSGEQGSTSGGAVG